MIDVLVVGGGPVGLAAAIGAARLGLEVVVLEPRAGPIDKACGEGLMPPAVDALGRLGVTPLGSPFHGIRYVDGARSATAPFPDGRAGLGVRRTELHRALEERARGLGVHIERARLGAGRLRQEAGFVDADGRQARWLIAADGLHSPIRRALGLEVRPRGPERLGVRAHFRVAAPPDLVEVHWEARAEAYLTPVGADTVGLAILHGERGLRFDALYARFPALAERLGQPIAPPAGAGPFHVYARRAALGRVLLVGDAAGFLDPITGEGIRLGLASAEVAVRAIAAEAPEVYAEAWPSLVRRYWWMTSALLAASRRPFLRRRLVAACARFPRIFAGVLGLLAREAGAAPAPRERRGRGELPWTLPDPGPLCPSPRRLPMPAAPSACSATSSPRAC